MSPKWQPTEEDTSELALRKVVDTLYRRIVSAPSLAPALMPSGRGEWFQQFIRRGLEHAADVADRAKIHFGMDEFRFLGTSWARLLANKGVGGSLCETLRLAHDPDGKEESRGNASHARDVVRLFLQDKEDIDQILGSMIETLDPAEWARYPAWFGDSKFVDQERARAVRLRPYYNSRYDWLPRLLDDPNQNVRNFAAIHIGRGWPARVDERVIARLLEASRDNQFVWSWADHFNDGRMGKSEAQALLAVYAPVPSAP